MVAARFSFFRLAGVTALGALAIACGDSPQVAGSFKFTTPATAEADAPFDVTVTAIDSDGAPVPAYVGPLDFASTDDTAALPKNVEIVAADLGKKTVSVTFHTAGSWTVSVKDKTVTTIRGKSDAITVTPPPVSKFVVEGLPASADPGQQIGFTLVAQNAAGNTVANYRGKVRFTSTDPSAEAALPDYTFTLADAGRHAFSTSFTAPGAQTITIVDAAKASLKIVAGPVAVHGLSYTNPAPGQGKVRLVRNAGSGGAVLLLDVVMGAGASGWAAGMNLPLDLTRISIGSTPMTPGTVLNPGQTPQAFKAVAPTAGPLANLLVSGIAQKAAGAGAESADKTLNAGDVLYTLRLEQKAGAPLGVVFDGANLGPKFRAALRNKAGDDVVTQAEFAIGKLEVL